MDIRPHLDRYPVEVTLEDDTPVTVRPLRREDKVALAQFFLRVPEEDRFYLKENVTAPEVIQQWTDHIDYERVVPLVALAKGRIIADATLHRSRAPARRHVGEIRIVVDPEFRTKGLGSRLIRELIGLARAAGLDRVYMELVDRREVAAIQTALKLGFQEVALLRGRVRDIYGSLQDLSVMELSLRESEEP